MRDRDAEYWVVYYHDKATEETGVYDYGLEKALAKWTARHLNKTQKSVFYWAEPEPERYC